jgi:hypothetical protein
MVMNVLMVCILAEVGIAITLATGFLLIDSGSWGLLCGGFSNYGLPFSWRTIGGCSFWDLRLSLDGVAFFFDVLAYMSLSYILVIGSARSRRRSETKASPLFLLATVYAVLSILQLMARGFYVFGYYVLQYYVVWFVCAYSAVLVSGLLLFILGPGSIRPRLFAFGPTPELFRKILLIYGVLLSYLVVANVLFSLNQVLLPFGNLVFWFVIGLNMLGAIGALFFTYLNKTVKSSNPVRMPQSTATNSQDP